MNFYVHGREVIMEDWLYNKVVDLINAGEHMYDIKNNTGVRYIDIEAIRTQEMILNSLRKERALKLDPEYIKAGPKNTLITRGRAYGAYEEINPLKLGKPNVMLDGIDVSDELGWLKANLALILPCPTKLLWDDFSSNSPKRKHVFYESEAEKMGKAMEIENVIYNGPATIVFWQDGTKTVVKANDEPFDQEKGLAMAFVKKFHGNTGKYNNEIKKWTREYRPNKSVTLNCYQSEAWKRFLDGVKTIRTLQERNCEVAGTDIKETTDKYCENDVAMTNEACEALEETKKWVPITDYPNYEIDNRTNVRNANTHRIIPAKFDSEGKPYYMIYDRKLGRSRRVYLKDIKIK